MNSWDGNSIELRSVDGLNVCEMPEKRVLNSSPELLEERQMSVISLRLLHRELGQSRYRGLYSGYAGPQTLCVPGCIAWG